MQYTMKLLTFFMVFSLSLIGSTDAQGPDAEIEKPHHTNTEITFPLPDFTMQLLIDEPHVDPKPFQWPLIATTSIHLSSYLKSILETDSRFDSSLKVSLDTIPTIDTNAATTFPNSTIIKADFVGDLHLERDNGLGQSMTQNKVNDLINQAFKGDVLQNLWDNFQQDSTLQQVKNLKVWVIINKDDVNEVNVDTSRGTTQPNNTTTNEHAPLKIAAICTVMAFVVMFSVGSFWYLRHLRRNHNGVHSKGSSSTEESMELEDDPSVFSTEYWKDAWAQAATQVKPRPPRKQRQFKRKPSSVRPNLDSIVEEEEEEDWDDSSWAIEDALESNMNSGSSNDNDSEEDEASALSPNQLELEMDAEASCSSTSSAGSFFRDEDPELMAVLDGQSQSSGCFPGRNRQHARDVEMQMTAPKRVSKSSSQRITLQRMDSDEITLARNKVLAKKEQALVKPTVAEELEAVRKRVLLKEKQEPKEELVVETDELTMVHKRILAKREAEMMKEPEVVTDELTMMRNRILSKSQHGKGESRDDEII